MSLTTINLGSSTVGGLYGNANVVIGQVVTALVPLGFTVVTDTVATSSNTVPRNVVLKPPYGPYFIGFTSEPYAGSYTQCDIRFLGMDGTTLIANWGTYVVNTGYGPLNGAYIKVLSSPKVLFMQITVSTGAMKVLTFLKGSDAAWYTWGTLMGNTGTNGAIMNNVDNVPKPMSIPPLCLPTLDGRNLVLPWFPQEPSASNAYNMYMLGVYTCQTYVFTDNVFFVVNGVNYCKITNLLFIDD